MSFLFTMAYQLIIDSVYAIPIDHIYSLNGLDSVAVAFSDVRCRRYLNTDSYYF